VLGLVDRILPHYIGHSVHDVLVEHAVGDGEFMDVIVAGLGPVVVESGDGWHEATTGMLSTAIIPGVAEDFIEIGIAAQDGGELKPICGEWPMLPRRRMAAFLGYPGNRFEERDNA